jgi:hypothetical protein
MGLDTTHDCWHGAYSAFSLWRNTLAVAAGYDLYKVDGVFECALIDWGHIKDETLQGKWDKTPDDPLLVLIAHSDCEGCIYPEQQIALADRLEQLIPLLPNGGNGGHIWDYKEVTKKFADGLRFAFSEKEAVGFH